MKLENKNILLISPEPWEHLFVSKHHYATHLAERGNKVFFLGPPEDEYSLQETQFSNLWRLGYKGFPKGIRFYPSFVQRWLIRRKFEYLQQMTKTKFDLVWSFDNSVFYDFSALSKNVFCISHIVDLNQNFQTAKAASTANLCIGVIPKIVMRLNIHNPKTILITHGTKEWKNSSDKIMALPGSNSIKAVYAGNLAMPFIDWIILKTLFGKHPDVDFILVGSNHEVAERTLCNNKFNNLFFLPQVSSKVLSGYLKAADILLLAYTSQYYENYASPHKLLEYFASGKTIVATWSDEYQKQYEESLILMSKSPEEFDVHFTEVKQNFKIWNTSEKALKRINFALANTYVQKINQVEKALTS
ncbi:glycosyltransferase [Cytophagales bacterium LB-30]|uniref:Glycosyltransferase n=1 Tax=Shiella aurantiaca TaxID=3058365 RepID=A0ABT8F2T0_9BACT|nr:glycosyltransferase [Shiella aurantiaca]MDN4164760.1 glycosyltransferase [Shiella aurantiaca]